MGRSSRGEEGGDDDERRADCVNDRVFDGSEFRVRDIGEVERMPTREVSGRMGVVLIGLKVLKNRKRGIKRRIMKDRE